MTTKTKRQPAHTVDLYDLHKERGSAGRYGAVETLWHEFGTREQRDLFMAERRRTSCVVEEAL